MDKPQFVVIESPYAGNIDLHTEYARAAMADSLGRGESPYVPHLLYTQPGVLDDNVPDERQQGMAAAEAVRPLAASTVFYVDLGMSPGMQAALEAAQALSDTGHTIEFRRVPGWEITNDEIAQTLATFMHETGTVEDELMSVLTASRVLHVTYETIKKQFEARLCMTGQVAAVPALEKEM